MLKVLSFKKFSAFSSTASVFLFLLLFTSWKIFWDCQNTMNFDSASTLYFDKIKNQLKLYKTLYQNLEQLTHCKCCGMNSRHQSSLNHKHGCRSWKISRIWKNEEPQIKLDPKRILYPGIMYGPNNQVQGLKESIYFSIRTNR